MSKINYVKNNIKLFLLVTYWSLREFIKLTQIYETLGFPGEARWNRTADL